MDRRNFLGGVAACALATMVLKGSASEPDNEVLAKGHALDVQHWRGQDGIWRHRTALFGREAIRFDWPNERYIILHRYSRMWAWDDVVANCDSTPWKWNGSWTEICKGSFVIVPAFSAARTPAAVASCPGKFLSCFRIEGHDWLAALCASDAPLRPAGEDVVGLLSNWSPEGDKFLGAPPLGQASELHWPPKFYSPLDKMASAMG